MWSNGFSSEKFQSLFNFSFRCFFYLLKTTWNCPHHDNKSNTDYVHMIWKLLWKDINIKQRLKTKQEDYLTVWTSHLIYKKYLLKKRQLQNTLTVQQEDKYQWKHFRNELFESTASVPESYQHNISNILRFRQHKV